MKRTELERRLRKLGWFLARHGGNHDIWTNGVEQVEVPRHSEISEKLARFGILRIAEQNPGARRP
ncbi:MAG: type II toxin-antitoxin system HicA family toxin [Pseudomonadota bacterium]